MPVAMTTLYVTHRTLASRIHQKTQTHLWLCSLGGNPADQNPEEKWMQESREKTQMHPHFASGCGGVIWTTTLRSICIRGGG